MLRSWFVQQDGTRSQQPDRKTPNKVRGSDDGAGRSPRDVEQKKKLTRAVTCVRCFRLWRLAVLPVRRGQTAVTGPGSGPDSAGSFTLQKPAAQKARRAAERAHATRPARAPHGPNMGFLPSIFGDLRHDRSLYKAGNPPRGDLTELKFKFPSATRENTKKQPETNI